MAAIFISRFIKTETKEFETKWTMEQSLASIYLQSHDSLQRLN